jgi:hypothetical protein
MHGSFLFMLLCAWPKQRRGGTLSLADEIMAQAARLRALWPALNSKPEVTDEIRNAVLRHAGKLVASDVREGFDNVIAQSPTSGWPPGPHEVVGCVLRASDARRRDAVPLPELPRTEVAGQSCTSCNGPVELIPRERIVYCRACNLVQRVASINGHPRWHLEWGELNNVSVTAVPAGTGTASNGTEAMRKLQDAIAQRRSLAQRKHSISVATVMSESSDAIAWDDAP